MNIESLSVGEVFSTTSKLFRKVGLEYVAGKKLELQKRELARYIEWEYTNKKNKPSEIVVTNIYEVPLEKVDGRINNGGARNFVNLDYSDGLCIDKRYYNEKGVYKIELDNDIYIGSTISGFRNRFMQHNYGQTQYTKDLLDLGGEFSILWIADEDDSEEYIRSKEEEYIKYYNSLDTYNVINKYKQCWAVKNPNKKKKKYTSVRVNVEQVELAFKILKNNGIDTIINTK